jgi:hypothetical protein
LPELDFASQRTSLVSSDDAQSRSSKQIQGLRWQLRNERAREPTAGIKIEVHEDDRDRLRDGFLRDGVQTKVMPGSSF